MKKPYERPTILESFADAGIRIERKTRKVSKTRPSAKDSNISIVRKITPSRGSERKRKIKDWFRCDDLLRLQDYRCGICDGDISAGNDFADHDHATGMLRGMLCRNCNTGIGLLRDSPEVLRKAIDYLLRPPGQVHEEPVHDPGAAL